MDVVERAWLDLSKMGMQSEMDTSMMISRVEKLLPPIQRRERAIFKQRLSEKTSFNTLLHFLLQKKTAIEHTNDELRSQDTNKRGKANLTRVNQLPIENDSFRGEINEIQSQMKIVIDGLAQVAQAVAGSSSYEGKYYQPNIQKHYDRQQHKSIW